MAAGVDLLDDSLLLFSLVDGLESLDLESDFDWEASDFDSEDWALTVLAPERLSVR